MQMAEKLKGRRVDRYPDIKLAEREPSDKANTTILGPV